MFQPSFRIANHMVGPRCPVLVVAEAGVSHFGDMDLAYQLVELACKAGADVFKTQIFDVEALIARRAGEWRDRLRPRNLTFQQARELKDLCDRRGILFMATAHDETRIPWLKDLDVPAIKVGSGERNNPVFLTNLARLSKPMILSTGMYGETDVMEAIEACALGGCDSLALLHCVTSYPVPPDQVNLASMDRLRDMFPGPVGYSDHTEDDLAVLAAVARGAAIIEKHITILRDIPNAQDWRVSAGPESFPKLVADIRRIEKMSGSARKEPAPCEAAGMAWALKSVVAKRDLTEGQLLSEEDLCAKRPGGGVAPNHIGNLLGRRLKHSVAADDPLTIDDVVEC